MTKCFSYYTYVLTDLTVTHTYHMHNLCNVIINLKLNFFFFLRSEINVTSDIP